MPTKKIASCSSKELSKDPIEGDYMHVSEASKKKFMDSKDKSNYVGRHVNSSQNANRQANARFGRSHVVSKKTVRGETRCTYPVMSMRVVKPGQELLLNCGPSFQL